VSDRAPEDDEQRARAAEALATVRAAVRQRRAELAAAGGAGEEFGVQIADLRRREFVQEPQPVSPRPGFGRLIVALRKLVYHLFVKWHARAVLQQQNEFNQAAGALLATLAEREQETRHELARLRARVGELESIRAPDSETGAGDRA
jgi:hypothetical protein